MIAAVLTIILGLFSSAALLLLFVPENRLFTIKYSASLWVGVVVASIPLIMAWISAKPHLTKENSSCREGSKRSLKQKIQERAYALYEERGMSDDHALRDWLVAEKELRAASTERLKLLFDYTKFHIGLYSAIIVGVATGLVLKPTGISDNLLLLVLFSLALLCLLLSGFAGGVILSNIIHYSEIEEFKSKQLLIWTIPTFRYREWTGLQYATFWVAVLLLMLGVFYLVLFWPARTSA